MEKLYSFDGFGPVQSYREQELYNHSHNILRDNNRSLAVALDLAFRPAVKYDTIDNLIYSEIEQLIHAIQQHKKICKKYKLIKSNKARERNINRSKQEVAKTNENRVYNDAMLKNRAFELRLRSSMNDQHLITKLNLINLFTNGEENSSTFYDYAQRMPSCILRSTSEFLTEKNQIWDLLKKKRSYELELVQVILSS